MKENLLGIDVGGTKCAIIYGIKENDELISSTKRNLIRPQSTKQ